MRHTTLSKPAVIQRRSSITDLQAVFDGVAVTALCHALITSHIGAVTTQYTILVVLLLCTLGLVYDAFGIYRKGASFPRKALDLLQAWSLSFLVLLALGFATKQTESFSRLLLGQLFLLGYIAQATLHLLMRLALKEALRHTATPDNVIIVGAGRLAAALNQRIARNEWLGQRVVGFVPLEQDGPPAQEPQDPKFGTPPPCLGGLAQLVPLIDRYRVRTVYFAVPLNASAIVESQYFRLLDQHVAVHWVPDIFSLPLVNHTVSEIAGIPVLTLSETPLIGTRRLVKLAEDMCLSVLLLVVLAPVLVALALAVRLDSPGPAFFRQSRLGWGGKRFDIWKFRTMYVHDDHGDVVQARRGDPRVTRLGAFLRRTSLDELPQIFNVICGDMSLVGPRPHAVQHDVAYARQIAHYFARHQIKPGITGLAQVRGYRGETRDVATMLLRVESDIEYINRWSLGTDLLILVRTLGALTGRNAY